MKRIGTILASIVSLFLLASPVPAHHGVNSEYDAAHPRTLKGTVTQYAFANPHIQIYFDVTGSDGKVEHWGCEGPSPGILIRNGWPRNAVKPGDQITAVCDPARSGASVGALKTITLPDGTVLKAY